MNKLYVCIYPSLSRPLLLPGALPHNPTHLSQHRAQSCAPCVISSFPWAISLHRVVCICPSQPPSSSHSLLPPLDLHAVWRKLTPKEVSRPVEASQVVSGQARSWALIRDNHWIFLFLPQNRISYLYNSPSFMIFFPCRHYYLDWFGQWSH